MAFYEMLPGAGMPPGLQAGMDSVLNKKFGTSTTYPAEDWPDTVNLMGPLPEKTVSGAIVTFSDGADEVPLKKCEITLAASLDGYSEVDVVSAGKNLLDFSAFSDYSNWKTDITENQSYPTANANRGLLIDLPQGTYTLSFGIDAETYPTYFYLCKDDGSTSTRLIYFTGANFSTASGSFTVDGTSKYYFRMGSTGSEANFNSQIAKIAWGQIEAGSTVSTFEPYSGDTHTASLGRTIHGGTADVVKGEGVDGTRELTISGDVVYYGTYGTDNAPLYYWEIPDYTTIPIKPVGSSSSANLLMCSDIFSRISTISSGDMKNKEMRTQDAVIPQRLYFRWDEMADVNAINTYLESNPITVLVELQTFVNFTFDPVPIDSKLGNNTLWSEQGSAEVTYRADINLALGGN